MFPSMQTTIAHPVSVAGFGYWSGKDIHVEFRPAMVDTGIVFVRADLGPHARIAARVENRIDMARRTNLQLWQCQSGNGGARTGRLSRIAD